MSASFEDVENAFPESMVKLQPVMADVVMGEAPMFLRRWRDADVSSG
jgi:hypothetical protein